MRNVLLTSVMAATIGLVGIANAQAPNWPATVKEAKTWVAEMPADAWIKIMQASLSLKFFMGKPLVAVLNATDEELVTVLCGGKWTLVGADPYIKGAPASIPSRSVGFVPTKGFDYHCRKSIVGITENGKRYNGVLSIPGDFTNSTQLIFR